MLAAAAGSARGADASSPVAVFDSAAAVVRREFFDPRFNGADIDTIAYFRRQALLPPRSSRDVAKEVNGLLSELHFSGGRFFRDGEAPDFTPGFLGRMTRDGL